MLTSKIWSVPYSKNPWNWNWSIEVKFPLFLLEIEAKMNLVLWRLTELRLKKIVWLTLLLIWIPILISIILHLTIFYPISTFIPYLQTSLYLPLITQSSKTSVLFWSELTWVSKHSFSISDFLPHLDVFRSQASKKDHDSLIHRIDFCLLIWN